jgi:hypothetical protein
LLQHDSTGNEKDKEAAIIAKKEAKKAVTEAKALSLNNIYEELETPN